MPTDERKPTAVERAARAVCMYKTGDPARVDEFRREAQIAVEAAGVPWQPDYAEKLLMERAEAAEQRVRELEHERDGGSPYSEREKEWRKVLASEEHTIRGVLESRNRAETKLATAVEALKGALGLIDRMADESQCVLHDEIEAQEERLQQALSEIEQGDAK